MNKVTFNKRKISLTQQGPVHAPLTAVTLALSWQWAEDTAQLYGQ